MKMGNCILGLALLARGAAHGGENKPAGADDWADAHQKFVEFITPNVEQARGYLNDPHVQWTHVKNALLEKYLPDVRLYVRDGFYADDTLIWIVTKDGHIENLGNGTWRGTDDNHWFAVEKVTSYVKSRKIKVETADQAVEMARLVEAIQSAPSLLGMLRLNTKDYTVLDERFLTWMFASKNDWKYSAAEKEGGWEVKVEYATTATAMLAR